MTTAHSILTAFADSLKQLKQVAANIFLRMFEFFRRKEVRSPQHAEKHMGLKYLFFRSFTQSSTKLLRLSALKRHLQILEGIGMHSRESSPLTLTYIPFS